MRDGLNLWDQIVLTKVSGKLRLDCSYTNPGCQFLKLTASKLVCFEVGEGLFRPNIPKLRSIGVMNNNNNNKFPSKTPISTYYTHPSKLTIYSFTIYS